MTEVVSQPEPVSQPGDAAEPEPRRSRSRILLIVAFVVGIVVLIGIAALLVNISTHKQEAQTTVVKVVDVEDGETDPAVWGQNYPREYSSFVMTEDDTVRTTYGGSEKYDKLARFPAMKRLWNGYAFAVEFNEDRGHHYALIDQKETKRQEVVKQPGACANCHSGDAPNLIKSMGWEAFNKGPYSAISDQLHSTVTCNDCHDPDTMALRITRPAFTNAMTERGIDVTKATRQDMRSYVCGQCHVEYYFVGDNKILTFPWEKGLNIDNINDYYDEYGFKDWEHKDTGAPMIKVQHPEYELYSTSVHNQSGVACADCHMPYVREGALKVTDHWIRSPHEQHRQCLPVLPQDGRGQARRADRDHPGAHGRPAPRDGDRDHRRHRRDRGREGGRGHRRSAQGGARLPAQGEPPLGLHLVGEQHRVPQPAGGGARAG